MVRSALFCHLLLGGCTLYDEPVQPPEWEPRECLGSAEIFSPADGATVSPSFTAHYRWNAENETRVISMSDNFSHYFIPSSYEILGDGSQQETYDMPRNGGPYTFELYLDCTPYDDNYDDGFDPPYVERTLAKVTFYTGDQ